MNSRSLCNKLQTLNLLLKTETYDIIFVTESWFTDKFSDSEILNGSNYNLFRCDRVGKIGGGVALLIKQPLKVKEIVFSENFQTSEILAIDLSLPHQKFRFILCYRPPNQTHEKDILLFQAIQYAAETNSVTFLLGDFNFPELKWNKAEHFAPGSPASNFLEVIHTLGLFQYVKQPTLGENILDLIFSSSKQVIHFLEVREPFSTSDHNSIYFEILGHSEKVTTRSRDYLKGDYDRMNIFLQTVNWPEAFADCANIEDFYQKFQNILQHLILTYVPFKKPRSKFLYPGNIRLLQSKKRSLWKKRKDVPDFKTKYNSLSRKTEKEILDFQISKERKLLAKGSDLKNFYNYVNKKLKVMSIIPDLEVDGKSLSEDVSKTNAFNKFFGSVFTVDNGILPQYNVENPNPYGTFPIKFTPEIILAALNKLKPSLAAGPDDINAFVLKKLKLSVIEPLSTIFEVSYRTGKLPSSWLKAIVVPIFKKGSPYSVENYRPISLCCVTCKLMESIINKSLMDYLKINHILKKQQFGFQKDKSCTLQLLKCVNDWTVSLDKKESVDVVYIDFQKAFDSVVHDKLLLKLRSILPNRFFLAWVKSFLSSRTQVVKLNQTVSDSVPVISGVPQGSVLGPTLFLIFINDIVESVKHSSIMLFADDLKVYNPSSEHDALQADLTSLASWASEWQLSVSITKCNVLYLGKNNPKHQYILNSNVLPDVGASCKDLGIFIASNLGSSIHCQNIISKASRVSGLIHRAFVSNDRNMKVRAFITYVRPLLEYSTSVWNPHLFCDINNIENIQRRFTKRFFGKSQISYDDRLKTLGLDRLELRRIHVDAIMAYNIIRNSVLPSNDFYTPSSYSKTRSHETESVYIEKFRLDCRKFGFAVRSAYIWNKIPVETKNAKSLTSFKVGIKQIDFSEFLKGRK